MKAKFGELYQTHGTHVPAKFRLDRFILSSCGGENPQFLPFFGLRNLVMSPIVINLRNLSTVHNYKASPINGIKIVSVLQRLHGEIGRTNSEVQKRDGQTDKQTDRQTKKLNVFGHPGGG